MATRAGTAGARRFVKGDVGLAPLATVSHALRRHAAAFALAAALVVGLFGASSPASAANWGPVNSFYNSIERVNGAGTFTNNDYASATTHYVLTDPRRDGNPVYATTRGYTYGAGNDNVTRWTSRGTESTREIQNTTEEMDTSFRLNSEDWRARGHVQVCAQMGVPVPDSCSIYAYPTFDY
ncbi:hypothetical protein [Actinomyces wuliandei]|uniref:hypothetical protein n=1 Tax=Actinomyces wuliandei TaxID=2057743 RepID=UPI001118012E|nr:hypothetical protein [Actinomyces wuliandei]